MHAIQRRAEADASRVVVVDEDPGALCFGVDGDADVVAVAHQQQLRDLLHRVREADHAVAPVVRRVGQLRHDGLRDGEPVRRRVHLLLGQIELAGADILVRLEADLLEPDDA